MQVGIFNVITASISDKFLHIAKASVCKFMWWLMTWNHCH